MASNQQIDQIKEAILSSSNNVELNAYDILKKTEWNNINENTYYTDPCEGKLREVDLLATRIIEIKKEDSRAVHEIIFLIECKYIKNETIFWFRDRKEDKVKFQIQNNNILGGTALNLMPSEHHYLSLDKIAKKWDYVCEGNKTPSDVIGKSINQLNQATYYFNKYRSAQKIIFPILLVNSYDNIYKALDARGNYEKINNFFQIEAEFSMKIGNHAVENHYRIIDVVSVDDLNNFISDFNKSTFFVIDKKLDEKRVG